MDRITRSAGLTGLLITHIRYCAAITTQYSYPVHLENPVILSFLTFLVSALQHAALLHRIFRHADVLLVVRAGERPLIGDAQRREAEWIVRLQLARPARMLNGLIV